MKKILLLILICFTFLANAQTGLLAGTGYAPNFTVTDINGNTHNLYNYLDSGKVVVLELMSVTCGHCQSHAAGTENSYQTNGPSGTNVARFLGLEVNAATDSAAVANFASTYGVTFPIANNVSPTAINYQLYYTPGYYVIYPDRSYTTICGLYCVTAQNYSTIEGLLNTAIAAWIPPIYGCTDSLATNYNPLATIDDGNCCISSTFQQIGGDIDGENAEDNSGSGLAISSDGNIIAIGAVGASIPNYPNYRTGHVRIYENNGGTWTQLGGDIDGEDGGPSGSTGADYSGERVALSSNGNIVAIGARFNDGNGLYSGHVRVYERDTNPSPQGPCTHTFNMYDSWGDGWNGSSVDLTINGVTVVAGATVPSGSFNSVTFSANNGDTIGLTNWITGLWTTDVSWTITNGNGSVIAAGDHGDSGNCTGNCMSIGWTQIGQDIDGENTGDRSGLDLDISSDGNIVAIGAGYANGINGTYSGHVRIFENNNGNWIQIGQNIDGEASSDYSGAELELSSNGNIIAIGATGNDGNGNNSGHVRVFENNNGTWMQLGQDIDGEAATHGIAAVSINNDGSIVAIGSTNANQITNSSWCNIANNNCMTGHVRVFENINGTWTQMGQNIEGEDAEDYFGGRVSLSGDGNTVAIGATGNDGNGTPGITGANCGHVRIYENNNGVWTLTHEIDGESDDDNSGFGLALNDGGNIVAIGARDNDAAGNDAGHVRVYGSHCTTIVYGCTDSVATNYNPLATVNDSSCVYPVYGCTDSTATNYSPLATVDDGSCTYTGGVCAEDAPTGLYASNVVQNRATINWDNMNDANCTVDQYRIKFRPVGGGFSWTQKTMGQPVNSCLWAANNTDKLILNLTPSTTYEYRMKAWYCDGFGNGVGSAWTALYNFTTEDYCPNVGNLTVTSGSTTQATFTWDDSNGAYSFMRIKARVDTNNATWFNVGGLGVNYGIFTKDKNNLNPGTSYRAQARTWCDPNGGAWKSPQWTSLIYWTQPTVIRLEGGNTITNLAIYPNPSKDVFNVTFTSEDVQDLKVRVINVIGEELVNENLQQFIGEYTKQIDLTNNAKGIYFLEIVTNDGVINKKLILQ